LGGNVKPIVVTDTGFKTPWFRAVLGQGWDYLGSTRHPIFFTLDKGKSGNAYQNFINEQQRGLRQEAARSIESPPLECRFIIYKQDPQCRKDLNRYGKSRQSTNAKKYAEREKEPWLLATSLNKTRYLSKKVVKIYATRMQIEDSFRDLKTGLKMNRCGSRIPPRLQLLLLIVLVAQYFLLLLGLGVKAAGRHRRYQANSIKNRNVLYNQFIGLRAYKDKQLKLLKKHWKAAMDEMNSLIAGPQSSF
jgi:hypothetical protein